MASEYTPPGDFDRIPCPDIEPATFSEWLAAHDQEVREQVAREIETMVPPITVHIDYPDVAWESARKAAARIARGESRG